MQRNLLLLRASARRLGVRAMPTGFIIRPLEPKDVPAARALFASGMRETLIWGLRAELLRPTVPKGAIAFATAAAALYFPRAVSIALCALFLFALAGPKKIARDYISKSLSDDMLDPMARYRSKRGSGFWVAVSGSGEVIGTVALEPANEIAEHGWTWIYGDGELRRMSVSSQWRGRGVAKALFAALLDEARQHDYRRVVLSTSSLQAQASTITYPRLGFVRVYSDLIGFGNLRANFFAYAVDGSTLTARPMLHDEDDAAEFRPLEILRHLFAPTYRGAGSK